MHDTNETTTPITRVLVSQDQRMCIIAKLFGAHFPLVIEPIIYAITERMAEAYRGGFWQFWHLHNGGFYMAPEGDQIYAVSCDNYFTGQLSADALGITACLYAYSRCAFSQDERLGRLTANHYHLLRECMFEHPEMAAILGAID